LTTAPAARPSASGSGARCSGTPRRGRRLSWRRRRCSRWARPSPGGGAV